MIESIQLRDFQPHRNTEILLDKITTIIGDNRKGKTAIVRALKWIMLNQVPRSREGHPNIIRWGKKAASVTVKFDGGRKLTRRRTSRENTYKLDGETLRAVSRGGIPKLVLEAMGMTEDNFQQQFQSLFWFSETPAQISKRLNKMVDQEIIDGVSEELRKFNRKYLAQKELVEESINEAKATIKETKFAAAALGQVEKISKLEQSLGSLRAKKDLLQQTLSLKNETERISRQYAESTSAFGAILGIHKEITRSSDKTTAIRVLRNTFLEESKREVLFNACDAIERDFGRIGVLSQSIKEIYSSWSSLKEQQQQIQSLERGVRRSLRSCTAHEKRYLKLFRNKRCPVCGKPANLAKLKI